MKPKNCLFGIMLALMVIVSGCSSSDTNYVTAEQFRQLQLGDTWTYSETSVFTPPGGAAPIAFYYTHKVTVVNKADTGGKTYLAFQHEFTPASGTPPLGTEWDLFTQDPATREVKIVGNITPTGQFIQKANTLYGGAYFQGFTYKQDWDISDNLITFNSKVVGKTKVTTEIPIPGGFRTLDTWVVMSEEISDPQNVFNQGYLIAKISPTVGQAIEFDASFSTPLPGGTFGEMTVHSDLLSTNVSLDLAPVYVSVPYDSTNYTEPPTGSEQFRQLQLGDTWTYSETSVFTPPGGAAPIAFYYTHKVTVVNKVDPGGKTYLAFQHEFTPAPGTPPLGTEWDLFTQDPATREVKIVGNITPTGQFIQKGNTLYSGTYYYGLHYQQDWDIADNLITFSSTVIEKTKVTTEIPIPGGFRKLDTWVVMSEEISDPQNVFNQGYLIAKINPTVGQVIEFDASFSTPLPGGTFGEMTVHSDLLSTNVPLP
jgi:hypothetical protein